MLLKQQLQTRLVTPVEVIVECTAGCSQHIVADLSLGVWEAWRQLCLAAPMTCTVFEDEHAVHMRQI